MIEKSLLTEEMKQGLAQAYANKGFRTYIEHRIVLANNALIECLDKNDIINAQRYAQRMEMMNELLKKGREQYVNFEKLHATQKGIKQEDSKQ